MSLRSSSRLASTSPNPVTRSPGLLSSWAARAFCGKRRVHNRSNLARNGLQVESLEVRVMLDNQAPVVTAATPPAYTLWNNTALFAGANAFSVTDVDAGAGLMKATLSADNGTTLSLASTVGLTFTVGDGTDDVTMEFTGVIGDINAALDGMTAFTGSVGNANTSVQLTVDDQGNTGAGGPLSDTKTVSWINTVYDLDVAGPGILRLYGLETAETGSVSVDGADNVVYTVNGVDYTLPVFAGSVVSMAVFLRGGNDSFTVDVTAAALNITYVDAGLGDDNFNGAALINGITVGMIGGGGVDTLTGGEGDDYILLSFFDGGTVNGNGGNDTIQGSNVADIIVAGEGNDTVNGLGGNDNINVGNGNNTVQGGSGDDQITAGSGTDTLYGEGGQDQLYGGGGNDTLYGGNDGDILKGDDGDDLLYGGDGGDSYLFNASISLGSDQAFEYLGGGGDILDFGSTTAATNLNIDLRSTAVRVLSAGLTLKLNAADTFEHINGGLGNDTLIGNALDNIIWGSGGNDQLFGLQGNDTFLGSEGNDTYNFDADTTIGNDVFSGLDNGTDTINFFATTTSGTALSLNSFGGFQVVNGNLSLLISPGTILENILGTDLADNYFGNAANNQFDLRGGNDTAFGIAGDDRFIGGAGDDTLSGGDNNDTYVFDADVAEGTDTLSEAATLAGGVDTLDFTLTGTTTNALNIDLRIAGTQVIRAGAVSLVLGANNNFENVIGGAGNDNVIGNNLANSLAGWGGNDLIYGFNGNDNLDGGLGNDTFMFDADSNIGSDTVTDAGGTDTLNWLATTTGAFGATINLGSTAIQNIFISGFHALTLASGNSIENVIGTNLSDSIIGNALNNMLTANGGDDRLEGAAGDDTLVGGAGNDWYTFNVDNVLGNDVLNETGGGAADWLNFAPTQVTNLKVDLRIAAVQTVVAGRLTIRLQNATAYENVYGGQANDIIIGSTINNILIGDSGNDLIYGQGGNDFLQGDQGNDTLLGEAGRDIMIGGAGSDTINGGADADLVIGGSTSYDNDPSLDVAIPTIISIWTGAGSYATRSAAVQTGTYQLAANITVFDDGFADVLRGGTGTTDDQLDLFFSSALDTLPDFGAGLETNVVV